MCQGRKGRMLARMPDPNGHGCMVSFFVWIVQFFQMMIKIVRRGDQIGTVVFIVHKTGSIRVPAHALHPRVGIANEDGRQNVGLIDASVVFGRVGPFTRSQRVFTPWYLHHRCGEEHPHERAIWSVRVKKKSTN